MSFPHRRKERGLRSSGQPDLESDDGLQVQAPMIIKKAEQLQCKPDIAKEPSRVFPARVKSNEFSLSSILPHLNPSSLVYLPVTSKELPQLSECDRDEG